MEATVISTLPTFDLADHMRKARRTYAQSIGKRVTQRVWSEALGVTIGVVGNWETGKSIPTAAQLTRIYEVTGIPLEWLVRPFLGSAINRPCSSIGSDWYSSAA